MVNDKPRRSSLRIHRSLFGLSHLGETVPPRPNGAQVIREGGELRRIGGVVDKLLGFAPRPLQNILIAYQVTDAECRNAPLARAKELARPADFQVQFRQAEAIGGISEGTQALVRGLRTWLPGDKQAIGFAA